MHASKDLIYLYLMLHACVERFDVMGGRGNILGWDGEVNKASDKETKREAKLC
jgi:hypothetical protein